MKEPLHIRVFELKAVPPPFAQFIGEKVIKSLKGEKA